jgi:hypothetical protein
MAKRLIRLTEGDLRRIVKESVKKVIMEREDKGKKHLGVFDDENELNGPIQRGFMNGYSTLTFELFGNTYWIFQTNRGYRIGIEGTRFSYPARSITEAISAALQYAAGNMVRNPDGSIDW